MSTSARNMCLWILRTFQSRSADLMLTMWKSLVLPILDYCSQLWSPTKVGQIQEIEDIQKSFTRKIWHVNRGDYWERLSSFKLYSLQRRRERYRIIYTWKILEGLVPNVRTNKVSSRTSVRNGRLCEIPCISTSAPANIRLLTEGGFCSHGAKLFNAIPKSIRNLTNVNVLTFKKKLDEFLSSIADEPQSPGYTARRRADSNSLLHMIPACT